MKKTVTVWEWAHAILTYCEVICLIGWVDKGCLSRTSITTGVPGNWACANGSLLLHPFSVYTSILVTNIRGYFPPNINSTQALADSRRILSPLFSNNSYTYCTSCILIWRPLHSFYARVFLLAFLLFQFTFLSFLQMISFSSAQNFHEWIFSLFFTADIFDV